jgi:exodeoxyribonuclease VII small subunit
MKNDNISKQFEEKFKFLEDLTKELGEGSISVDQLVPKMKQATEAIKICKSVLKETKIELQQVEKEFEELISDTKSED